MHLDGQKRFALVLFASLLGMPAAQAANYYIGNDAACTHDRLALAVLAAAIAGDSNPVFYISRTKPAETSEVILNYNNLSTVQIRGGFNSCQDARNGVTPSGKSSVHSNALSTGAGRRVMTVGGSNSTPAVTAFDIFISGGRLNTNTTPNSFGAGVYISSGSLTLIRTTVEGNWNNPVNSNARGGGVFLSGNGRALVIGPGSVVRDNDAHDGGGIYCTANAAVQLEGGDIRDNRARARAGGVHIRGGCAGIFASGAVPGRIRDNRVTNFSAGINAGGGLLVGLNSTVSIAGTASQRFQVSGNQVVFGTHGGGIAVEGSSAQLFTQHADVDSNSTAGGGGGISCLGTGNGHDAVNVSNTRIRNNEANANGGGLQAQDCRAVVTAGTEITGNTANAQFFSDGGGGGVAAIAVGSSTVSRITVTGGSQSVLIGSNTGRNGGGALATIAGGGSNRTAEVILNNVRVDANSASGKGGGLAAIGEGSRINMRRTLAGSACHNAVFCSVLSDNNATASPHQGAAAYVANNADLTITGTYIERNNGRALEAENLQAPRRMRLESNVIRNNHPSRPLIRTVDARALINFNTIIYTSMELGRAVEISSGNSSDRQVYLYGNIFDGDRIPVEPFGTPSRFSVGSNGGCSAFSRDISGTTFFDAHTASRRIVTNLGLSGTTGLLGSADSPMVDFCDGGELGAPAIDILGRTRPHSTSKPNVHGNIDVGAYEMRPFDINASVAGQGSITSSTGNLNCPSGACVWPFAPGTTTQLTATPAPGWVFSQWTGSCSGTNPVCNLNMIANRSVSAVFLQQFELTFAIGSGGGGSGTVQIQPGNHSCSASCVLSFANGTTVTITAEPAPGSSVSSWLGACAGTSGNICTVTMTANRTAGVQFSAGPAGDQIFKDRFEP